MYLKRLELHGFKSFPEKIRLEFNRGITAIVGPNGSGKSNVGDGVRWVLGEQSAKSLRGSKMEDIIFAGTESRRPQGFAEVSMVIDNSDRKMALDFSEITVTRRVYRSGESEFAINGAACRLKDIHEMFMDTGIGREGYSIIGQGRIDEILNARSEDRRLLFEEAAGIVKYRSRRHEAEQKLERQRQNLVRVNDIISELELQLEPLRLQSEKAREYLDLREELKLIQVNLFVSEAARSEEELKNSLENLSLLNHQILKEQESQRAQRQEIESLKERSLDIDLKIKALGEELTELRLENEKRENQIRLAAEQINHYDSDGARLDVEIKKKQEAIAALNHRISEVETDIVDKEESLSKKRNELLEEQRDFEEKSEKLKESEQHIDQYNREIIERINDSTNIKSAIQNLNGEYDRLESRKELLNEEYEENNSRLQQGEVKLIEEETRLTALETQISRLNGELATLNGERAELNGEIAEKTARQFELNKAINESVSRHKLLGELERSHEGYNKSVKTLLNAKSSLKGIHGALGELVETEKKYETAIEIAMGGAIQNVVTDTEEDAREAIEYLKRNKEGRVTFLPLTTARRNDVSRRGEVLKEKGVIGMAVELVSFQAVYGNIFSNLLGRTLIVDTMENAIRIFKKYRHDQRIVTLEGELFSPGGAITGGSMNHRALSIVSRGREIKELSEKADRLKLENGKITEELEQLRRQKGIIDQQLEDNRTASQQRAVEAAALKQSLVQIKESIETAAGRKLRLDEENASIMARLVDTNREIREAEGNLLEAELEVRKVREELERFQSTISGERGLRDEKLSKLTDMRLEIGGLEQSLKSATEEIKRIENEIESHKGEIDRCGEEIQVNERLKEEKREEIQKYKTEIIEFGDHRKGKQEMLAALDDEKEDVTDEIKQAEERERDCGETISRLGNELTRLEMKKEQAEEELRKLYDLMWDEYKLTLQTAMEYKSLEMSPERMKKEERRIKNGIATMGDVNVGAIEEYKNVKGRYEQMAAQRDDIVKAEEKLLGLIGELTAMMESRFSEQIKVISENFSQVFKEMFGGGRAFLKLKDENNILESGIEISAQPPGKNLQSMSLLSGGERALTAIALLFGILRMKPSPFCIFDEVEAALDDANVVRFANFIKKFSEETQFILMTHRKGTMEASDTLYGVTMQEQGVSKLVSVRFTEEIS